MVSHAELDSISACVRSRRIRWNQKDTILGSLFLQKFPNCPQFRQDSLGLLSSNSVLDLGTDALIVLNMWMICWRSGFCPFLCCNLR